jgi:ribonuclease HI
MELLAVIVGLEKLKNPNTKVLVVSDSKYVVDSILKSGFWLGETVFRSKKC